jgi:SAM-dependent methyltransferase
VARVNYDQIAHLYDEPVRDHPVDPSLLAFLAERPDLSPSAVRILDVGCGTGKQQTANQGRFPEMLLVGLDRSMGMLQQAGRRGPAVHWLQGDAPTLPFAAGSFDFASNQFSYHHIHDQPRFLHELYRVLRPGGRFAMFNIDPWAMPAWIVYQFFPATWERDQQDFLPIKQFTALMAEAGFHDIQVAWNHLPQQESLAGFFAYASQRYRTSQLMAIPDEAYQDGLNQLQAQLSAAAGQPITVHSDLCLVRVTGSK